MLATQKVLPEYDEKPSESAQIQATHTGKDAIIICGAHCSLKADEVCFDPSRNMWIIISLSM
jgi:hypothetical protein